MNERIKELAEQAGLKVEYFMANPPKPFQILGSTEQFEKFAEKIVKECTEQIKTQGINASSEDYGDYEIGFNAGLFHALRTTKEHFGVDYNPVEE
jgi:hypothetical protein